MNIYQSAAEYHKIRSKYRRICLKVIRENAWQKCILNTDKMPGILLVPGTLTSILLYQFGRPRDEWDGGIGIAEYKFARNQINGRYYLIHHDCLGSLNQNNEKLYGGFTEITNKTYIKFLNKEFKKGHGIFYMSGLQEEL